MDPQRIAQLENPAVFPEGAGSIEVLQTHLSAVCLSGDHAYKFKKAIHLPFADFTELSARRHFCEEELRLNRRLAPTIYVEVVPLVENPDGSLKIGGDGEPVDYAVKMQRLPAECMMDRMLEADQVNASHIVEIAETVAAFHRTADRGDEIDALGSPHRLERFALENFSETLGHCGDLFSANLHAALHRMTKADFARWLPVLERRREAGRLVDGHGDLHARNICLTDPVTIYDCIEFEPAFRCADVATEHAFFLMDLRFRGHPEWARLYLDRVVALTEDGELPQLLPMLMRYRALVRAKVAAITAGEEEISLPEREEARKRARGYFRLAAALAIEESGPWWILSCGLPGSGKSTLAAALGEIASWPVLASDRIRKTLAGVAPTDSLPDRFYGPDVSDQVYAELCREASERTRAGCPVVQLDANFRSSARREAAVEAARQAGAKAALLNLDPTPEVVASRIRERSGRTDTESDADLTVYRRLVAEFEAPSATEVHRLLVPRPAEAPVEEIVDRVLAEWLR
ncbi:MAG: AAA family ATPase [Verrucomicrobiales bacterium]|nr:AAA family ATPase [Verrucomicrobiales bacterium]